ncbi:uncharacterized protein UBRO_20020 [Ustilago bromivora]|uniref:Uncharacterized protein n=1 Tax=Ustilago bromivora TaxID=307758 RepID=A0A1K0GL09_9BASI|nr:uncharacterized protein UBRO_20020 [Ustilago bromivora]
MLGRQDQCDAIFYDNIADIEDLSYSKEDKFDEELTQPLEDVYHPPSEEDLALKGDLFSPEPSEIPPSETPAQSELPLIPSDIASDGSSNFKHQPSHQVLPMPDPRTVPYHVTKQNFDSDKILRQHQSYRKKFHKTWQTRPWLHPTTTAILIKKYPRHWPDNRTIRKSQDSLQNCGLLADILDPIYQAKAQLISLVLQPTVKQALNGEDCTHWKGAIKAEMDGLERMSIWEIVDKPQTQISLTPSLF